MATITVQTKWQGVWGEKVRLPSGAEYQCSVQGDMEVSEEDARELCSTSGWRRKPVEVKRTPEPKRGRQPVAKAMDPEKAFPNVQAPEVEAEEEESTS